MASKRIKKKYQRKKLEHTLKITKKESRKKSLSDLKRDEIRTKKVLPEKRKITTRTKRTNKEQEFIKESKLNNLILKLNRRLETMDSNNYLKYSPAYNQVTKKLNNYMVDGRFTLNKAKNYNDLKKIYYALNNFDKTKTSSKKGMEDWLKTTAKNVGIKFKNVSELEPALENFFKIYQQIDKYYKDSEAQKNQMWYRSAWKKILKSVETQKTETEPKKVKVKKVKGKSSKKNQKKKKKKFNLYGNNSSTQIEKITNDIIKNNEKLEKLIEKEENEKYQVENKGDFIIF